MKKTIGVSDFKNNNFHFLRFFAASLVIFDHAFPLYGYSMAPYILLIGLFGALALPTFFAISGFLITKSWIDAPNIFTYFKKRSLRIFPGLAAATLFGVFIIGPMATSLSMREYFTNSQTWLYLFNIVLLIMGSLPGVFIHNQYPGAVNGSLWSLPYEFWMYIFIAFFGLIGMLSKKYRFLILFLYLLMIVGVELFKVGFLSPDIPFLHIYLASHFVQLGSFFVLGSLFYLYREKIILDIRLMVVALIMFILPLVFPSLETLQYISLPYMVIYFAFSVNIKFLKNFGKYGDFSYGMYIYAFPVQQTLVYLFGKRINFLSFIFLSYTITFLLSYISWNLIEKQALKLKKVNPRFSYLIFKKSREVKESPAI